ncbi:alpha-2B adrenergic receptor-like [Procambarus clarkii]|uniref:alpha-2B adrenergic receptor-like n=1 Tax=Procambarus clarkii TaxID=6728 RepID=UPI0037438E2E
MTNVSREEAESVRMEGEAGASMSMEVVGVGREGVVEGVVEKTMSVEIRNLGYIAYSVVAPVIISFGILTNILNLVVLTRPSLRGPTFRYLKWLAVANLLVCVVLLPFTLHTHDTPVPYPAALYFAHIEVPVGNALIASSVYIVVGLSIDRFVAVCYPRKYRNLHSHYVASVRISLSFVIAFIMYVPMAFYKMVVPASGFPSKFLIEENLQVVSTRWFMVYEYLLEICVRFAPAILLAVLNTWIIVEFKRISRRRLLLSRGMSCEVSAIPSQSYFEGNANTTVVNHSPSNGRVESEPAAACPNTANDTSIGPHASINIPIVSNPTAATSVLTTSPTTNPSAVTTPTNTVTSYSEISPLSQESKIETCLINSNEHAGHTDYKAVDATSHHGNGYKSVLADGDIASTRNSSSKSTTQSREGKETIGLSMINVSGGGAPVAPPRGMSERRHDMERRLVLLLVSIIVAFFITNIPAAILSLTFSDDKRHDVNFQLFRAIANNLEFLNFGLNFILYFLFSKDIRSAFMSLLRHAIDRLKEGIEGSSTKYAATNL